MIKPLIKNWLLENIRKGVYAPHSSLPPRRRIMERFQVARKTVDDVIEELKEEGEIYSKSGSGTFVSPSKKSTGTFVYLVTYGDFSNHSQHPMLHMLTERLNVKLDYTLTHSSEVDFNYSKLLMQGIKVIWLRASLKDYYIIDLLNRAKVDQFLVEREQEHCNYAVTDFKFGFDEIFKKLLAEKCYRNYQWGLMVPELDSYFPYRSQRENIFHETCIKTNLKLSFCLRYNYLKQEDKLAAVFKLFNNVTKPFIVFIPDPDCVPLVMTLVKERHLQMGKDLLIITIEQSFNRNESFKEGIITMVQDYEKVAGFAISWAMSKSKKLVQKLVKPSVVYNL